MAVFLTRRTATDNEWTTALQTASKAEGGKAKRKPTGVEPQQTEKDDDTTTPNLFVNVVDTVSGRILYRTSHAHAAESPAPTALISENWVIYTYLNLKTKRAQVGVLSLVREMEEGLSFAVFFIS